MKDLKSGLKTKARSDPGTYSTLDNLKKMSLIDT